MKRLTPNEEIVWLAAILEGEGSFGYESNRNAARVSLEMTDEDIVIKARDIIKRLTGKTAELYCRKRGSYKETYQIVLTYAPAIQLMWCIVYYMGDRRRSTIQAVLEGRRLINKIDLVALGLSKASTAGTLRTEPVTE